MTVVRSGFFHRATAERSFYNGELWSGVFVTLVRGSIRYLKGDYWQNNLLLRKAELCKENKCGSPHLLILLVTGRVAIT